MFSLQNKSNDVRWSLDLRWQRPGEPEGLHGIQQPVLMRDPQHPDLVIDWSPVDDSRHLKQAEYLNQKVSWRTNQGGYKPRPVQTLAHEERREG